MENIQINGQRIWGPPRNWLGPPPPHGTEIFIKNIPDDVSEMELHDVFSAAGKVYEVRLPVHWSGINRGYAFVRFTKISEANAAIKKLDKYAIRTGRHIKVERSIDNTRLFLSAVPNHKSGEDIKKDLLTVVDNVKTVYVYPALENSSLFRGYAFVEFNCHRDAAIAKRILTPDVCFNLFEKKCIAAWANPLPFLNQDILETINILFMRNIPKDMKSVTVKKTVEILIAPDTVQKVKRLNDFAFLTFKNHESAKRALYIIKNNSFFLGKNTEVQIEWAVPREVASAASCDMKENEKPGQNFSRNREDGSPVLKQFQNFKAVQDYLNLSNINLTDHEKNSEEFRAILSKERYKGPERRFGTSPDVNNMQMKGNLFHHMNSPKLIEWLSTPISGMDFSNINIVKNECLDDGKQWKNNYGEFRSGDSEESYRFLHMKHWFENLVCPPCTPSPSLTSSSADSPTNMSWKYDENRFSGGSGFPLDCDLKFDGKLGGILHPQSATYM